MKQIIEEEQAHGAQVAAFLQMQLHGHGKGGSMREGVEETLCSVGGASGNFEILA